MEAISNIGPGTIAAAAVFLIGWALVIWRHGVMGFIYGVGVFAVVGLLKFILMLTA